MDERSPSVWRQARVAIRLVTEDKPIWRRIVHVSIWWIVVIIGYGIWRIDRLTNPLNEDVQRYPD